MKPRKQPEPQKPKAAPDEDAKKKDIKAPQVDKMIRGSVKEK